MDQNVPEPVDLMKVKRDYVAIKVPQFSWTRLGGNKGGADPMLGVGKYSTDVGVDLVADPSYTCRNGFYR